jgi:outer membrane murein-binding lipoprotein Lpp
VRKEDKDKITQLEVAVEMMRAIVAQLQMDVHTLKSQQYLRDWTINGK